MQRNKAISLRIVPLSYTTASFARLRFARRFAQFFLHSFRKILKLHLVLCRLSATRSSGNNGNQDRMQHYQVTRVWEKQIFFNYWRKLPCRRGCAARCNPARRLYIPARAKSLGSPPAWYVRTLQWTKTLNWYSPAVPGRSSAEFRISTTHMVRLRSREYLSREQTEIFSCQCHDRVTSPIQGHDSRGS